MVDELLDDLAASLIRKTLDLVVSMDPDSYGDDDYLKVLNQGTNILTAIHRLYYVESDDPEVDAPEEEAP